MSLAASVLHETLTSSAPRAGQTAGGTDALEALEHVAGALERLMSQCPDLPVLAIPWMSVRHPLHAVHEQFLRGESADGQARAWPALAARAIRLIAEAIRLSVRLLWMRWTLRREMATLRRQSFDLIVKTWCFTPTPSADGRDFYYGDLPQRLAQRGVSTLLLCGDVRADQWKAFVVGHASSGEQARLPEMCLIPPWAPLYGVAQQFFAWRRVRRLARRTQDVQLQAIAWQASADCLTAPVLRTVLGYWIGHTAVRWWKPRAFLLLYEGNGWERCTWQGVRAAGFPCRVVGYQHTVLFRESLALTRPSDLRQRTDLPDIVLGLGPVPIQLMQSRHGQPGVRLLSFGSFRASQATSSAPAAPGRRTVLVAPEGILSEVRILFTFAAACAQRLPSYTFILRSHPEVPMARALQLAPPTLAEQPNVVLSEYRRIEEDFERASVLLYRGSSTVLYGVAKGLLPLFVHSEAAIDSDPLYALDTWHERVGSVQDVAEVLGRYEAMEDESRLQSWRVAAQFIADYTGPVSDARIDAFLAAAGLHGRPR